MKYLSEYFFPYSCRNYELSVHRLSLAYKIKLYLSFSIRGILSFLCKHIKTALRENMCVLEGILKLVSEGVYFLLSNIVE